MLKGYTSRIVVGQVKACLKAGQWCTMTYMGDERVDDGVDEGLDEGVDEGVET